MVALAIAKPLDRVTQALLASATARVQMVSQVRYQFSYTEEVQSAYETIMLEADRDAAASVISLVAVE